MATYDGFDHDILILGGGLVGSALACALDGSGWRVAQVEASLPQEGAPGFDERKRLLNSVDAVILCTPTQMHAEQAIACMNAGKHVQVEIPLCDSWADAEAVLAKQKETGLTCMVGHTRA